MKNIIRSCALLLAAVMLIAILPLNALAVSNALKGKTIVAFGDSLTALGNPTYVGYLNDLLGVDVINAGVGGNLTSHGRERFESDVLSKDPDLVLLCFGMNDQACSLPSGQSWMTHDGYRQNMSYFIETLQARGCDVVIITPHPVYEASGYYQAASDYTYNYAGSMDAFCRIMRELACEYNCGLVDMNYEFNLLKENDITTFKSYYAANDGVHQSQSGRQFWANKISEYLHAAYDGVSKAAMTVNCVDENGKTVSTIEYTGKVGANITIVAPDIPAYTTSGTDIKTVFADGKSFTFNYTSDLADAVEKVEAMDYTDYSENVLANIRTQYSVAKMLLEAGTPDLDAMSSCADALNGYLALTGVNAMSVSVGKSYDRPDPNYYAWDNATQSNSGPLVETYIDDYKRLTDGKYASIAGDSSAYSVWTTNADIIVDLGAPVSSNVYNAYFASYKPWGISAPANMKIACSDDKTNWSYVDATVVKTALTANDGWNTHKLTVSSEKTVNARYIKFEITKNGSFVWVDEVEAAVSSATVKAGTSIAGVDGSIANGTQMYTYVPENLADTDNVVATWDSNAAAYVITAVNVDSTQLADGDIIIASESNSDLANASAGQYLAVYGTDEMIAAYFVIVDDISELAPQLPAQVENLALNRAYTISGSGIGYAYDDPEWGPAEYQAKLTDGIASDTLDFNNEWFGFFNGTTVEPNTVDGIGTVIIDLGKDCNITQVRAHFRNFDQSSVKAPKSVTVSVAKDGSTDYTDAGKLSVDTGADVIYWADVDTDIVGRYVKMDIEMASTFVFVNEIEVYGNVAEADEGAVDDGNKDDGNKDDGNKDDGNKDDSNKDNENNDLKPTPPVADEYVLGDVNKSGDIDMMDYILLKRNYFGTFTFDETQLKAGDCNKSGDIDMMDYILLKRAYFGTFELK